MPQGFERASKHYRWNDRKIMTQCGHVKVRVGRSHPLADPNGYAYEHLLIWVAAGNPRPEPGLLLHHLNGDKSDNRIENLELLSRGEHNRLHNREKCRKQNGQFGKKASGRELDGRTWDEFPGVRP